MPTKTKTSSSVSKTQVGKKSVAKKKSTAKKKVTTVKNVVEKKSVTKKPVAKKKISAKKSPAKKSVVTDVPELTIQVEEQTFPVITMVEKQVHSTQPTVEVHHKVVFLGSCKNCEHMPMGVNKLIGILSISIAILSGLLISTSLPGTFEMPSISMSGITEWINGYNL